MLHFDLDARALVKLYFAVFAVSFVWFAIDLQAVLESTPEDGQFGAITEWLFSRLWSVFKRIPLLAAVVFVVSFVYLSIRNMGVHGGFQLGGGFNFNFQLGGAG